MHGFVWAKSSFKTFFMKFFSAIVLLFFSVLSFAQTEAPVSWTFTAERIDATTVDISATAVIDEGWYVYSKDTEEGGPIPTTITYEGEARAAFPSKESKGTRKEGMSELFGVNVIKYSGQLRIDQRVTVPAGEKQIAGYVTYMTCDNETCLPPTDVAFDLSF